ncbi:MAG: hypothetical protein WDN10_01135 [bacterium]
MRSFIAVLFSIAFSTFAMSAQAQIIIGAPQTVLESSGNTASSTTVYLGVSNNYMFQDFGFMASRSAVVQGGVTRSFGNGNFCDLWGSVGAGGSASEVDLSCWHDGKLGFFDYEVKGAYYFLSLGKDRIGDLRDDAFYAHLNVGHTFDLGGRWSVTPYARLEGVIGTSELPFQSVVRVIPASVTYQATDWLTLQGEGGKVFCLSGNCYSPWYAGASGTIRFGEDVSLIGKYKPSTSQREDTSFSIEIDWKVN